MQTFKTAQQSLKFSALSQHTDDSANRDTEGVLKNCLKNWKEAKS